MDPPSIEMIQRGGKFPSPLLPQLSRKSGGQGLIVLDPETPLYHRDQDSFGSGSSSPSSLESLEMPQTFRLEEVSLPHTRHERGQDPGLQKGSARTTTRSMSILSSPLIQASHPMAWTHLQQTLPSPSPSTPLGTSKLFEEHVDDIPEELPESFVLAQSRTRKSDHSEGGKVSPQYQKLLSPSSTFSHVGPGVRDREEPAPHLTQSHSLQSHIRKSSHILYQGSAYSILNRLKENSRPVKIAPRPWNYRGNWPPIPTSPLIKILDPLIRADGKFQSTRSVEKSKPFVVPSSKTLLDWFHVTAKSIKDLEKEESFPIKRVQFKEYTSKLRIIWNASKSTLSSRP